MALKCICLYQDSNNDIVNSAVVLTIDQAAAVASGYQPCCAAWLQSEAFIRKDPNMAVEVSHFRQKLRQDVASGELKSKMDRLNRTERLIDRQVLGKWLAKLMKDLAPEDDALIKHLLDRRVQAIHEEIQTQRYNPKAITIGQKATLRKKVEANNPTIPFSSDTFAKAWAKGGTLGLWAIKNKERYTKGQHSPKDHAKRS